MADPRSEELKASMGEKSTYRTGNQSAENNAGASKTAGDTGATPAGSSPDHVGGLIRSLKGLLGIDHTPAMGEANPANAGVLKEAGVGGALNRGIAEGTKAPAE